MSQSLCQVTFGQCPAPTGPKWVKNRSIRVLYTLWLGLSLLGHESVLGEETHRRYVCNRQGKKRKSFFMCVFCVYDTKHIHRWRAVWADKDQTMTNSFGVPLGRRDSSHRVTALIDWLTDELMTDWGRVRLTGDSGTWSSSREKELLKALLNVSLFCLCRSIVDRITWELENIWSMEEEEEWKDQSGKWWKNKKKRWIIDQTRWHFNALILFVLVRRWNCRITAWCRRT